jgi:hypothetical protein
MPQGQQPLGQRFYVRGVHIHGQGALDEFDRNDKTKLPFATYQNSLQACQGAAL